MKPELVHDKTTDVAFIDFFEAKADSRIRVIDVSDDLGLKSQVLARVDQQGNVLGVVIEDFSAFRREVRLKYAAFAVDKIIELIVTTVRGLIQGQHQLATC